MKSPLILEPELFSGAKVYLSPLFLGCDNFVIRRSLLGNADLYKDAETITGLSKAFNADTPAIDGVIEVEDLGFLAYFSEDADKGTRTKFTRTPWYISDADGDAILFVSDSGERRVFERRFMDLFGIDTLYLIASDNGESFTDVDTAEVDGNLVISCCEVAIPAIPGEGAKAEKKPKEKKKSKKEDAPAEAAASPVPTSGAIPIPPADEGVKQPSSSDDVESEEEDSLGPPTVGPTVG